MLVYFCSEKKNFCKAVTLFFVSLSLRLCFPFSGLLVFVSFMMDQGEPGKDLPILEQTREADPHETESSKKMEAATEPTPDTLMATTEMVNATFEVTAPVALQEHFSPFEDVSPPAELPKVIFFFADLDCGFSSKYVVMNNAKFY